MHLVQYFGGVSSDTSIDENMIYSSNAEIDSNIKAGNSTLSSKKSAETIGLAVFKDR